MADSPENIIHSGSIIGRRYRIEREIGRGGFGKTYLAKDCDLPDACYCVVKRLEPKVNTPAVWEDAKNRFANEAMVLKRLGHHERIPSLLAYFQENQEFYLVQEYIDGEDLSKHILQQPYLEAEVILLLQDILEVLDFVHQQGVIHRDLKPSNIIRRKKDGRFVAIDFGAVKEISSLSFNPQTQGVYTQTVGTQGYMPPEQIAGKPIFASDIYALSRTAISALTGRSPLEFEDIHTGELKGWQSASMSPQLVAILNKMAKPGYGERYHSAAEVLQDLQPLCRIGKIVAGGYKLIGYLGGGITSQTYLAENLRRQYQSPCIIKQLKPQNREKVALIEAQRRFSTEINVLEKLGNHPQIPTLWDHFEENQEFYLVQEYIDGENLDRELQQEGIFSEEKAVALLEDTLPVLDFIHQQGIIHRDINPCNLMRRRQDGKIILIDFSIVKEIINSLTSSSDGKNSTQPLGTEGYMPPEQIAGRPTFASDIYSLGMTAIKLLTGIAPEQLQTHPDTGTIIWQTRTQVNPKLGALVDRMVNLDLGKRYTSAAKVLEEVQKIHRSSPLARVQLNSSWFEPLINLLRKQGKFALAGLIALFSLTEMLFPTLRPQYYIHQAEQKLTDNPSQALSIFKQAIELNPKKANAWKGEGDAFYNLERYQDALDAYERAIQLDAKNSPAWRGRGDALFRLERFQAAIAAYNKSIEINPQDALTWNRKGKALYQTENHQEALTAQEKALEIQPNNAEALSDKGIALIGLQRYRDALVNFNKAQVIKPLDPRFWQNKALALQYLGRPQEVFAVYQEALDAYDKLLQNKSTDVTALIDRGYVLSQIQRYEEALTSYEKAIILKPDSYLGWLGKGNALFALGRFDIALAAFDRALEIRPESYLTWQNRGALLRDGKQDYAQAIKSFDKALAINPGFYPAWRDRGLALSQWNQQQQAISSFDEALKIEPNDYRSWVGRAIALASLNRRSEALAAFDKALTINPKDIFIWMNRGLALEEWGEKQEAKNSYKKAIEINPGFQDAIARLEKLN